MQNTTNSDPSSELESLAELVAKWRRMLKRDSEEDRKKTQGFYFEHILPLVLQKAESREEHARLREQGYHTLVSLMGFSPETTVITTAILRPKRLVIVYSRETADSYEIAFEFLVEKKVLKRSQIHPIEVDPTQHFSIYRKIREAILEQRNREVVDSSLRHIVDVTGGKKVMSATAAQAAWELNLPLCYLESGRYDPVLRRPLPGAEVLQRLPDPGQEKGRHKRQTALQIFRRRNYKAAIHAFRESMEVNENHILEELGLTLCRCYAAWTDLDLPSLTEQLRHFSQFWRQAATVRFFEQRAFDTQRVERHIDALSRVAEGDEIARIATFLELARLYQKQERHDFSCLLSYRGMEDLTDFGLRRCCSEPFDRSSPDYQLLADAKECSVDELRSEYVRLSQDVDANRSERDLPRKVGFVAGVALLCLVADIHKRFRDDQSKRQTVREMLEAANRRNTSILAHGIKTLGEKDSDHMLQTSERLARVLLGRADLDQLVRLKQHLAPLPLADLNDAV